MPARDAAKDGQRALSPDIRGYRDARHISRLSATQHHLPRTPLAAACPLTHRHPQGLGAADPALPSQPKAFSSASKALSPMFSLQRVSPYGRTAATQSGERSRGPLRAMPPRSQRFEVPMVAHTMLEAHTDTSKRSWTSAPNLPDLAKTGGLRWVRTASVAIRNLTCSGCWQKTRLARAPLVINRTGAPIQVHGRRLQGRQLRACGLAARHRVTRS